MAPLLVWEVGNFSGSHKVLFHLFMLWTSGGLVCNLGKVPLYFRFKIHGLCITFAIMVFSLPKLGVLLPLFSLDSVGLWNLSKALVGYRCDVS